MTVKLTWVNQNNIFSKTSNPISFFALNKHLIIFNKTEGSLIIGFPSNDNLIVIYLTSYYRDCSNLTSFSTISLTNACKSYFGSHPNLVFDFVGSPISKSTSVGL